MTLYHMCEMLPVRAAFWFRLILRRFSKHRALEVCRRNSEIFAGPATDREGISP